MSIKTDLLDWLADQEDPAIFAQVAQVRDWHSGAYSLTQAQVTELQRRLRLLDDTETERHSWEDVKANVRQRYHGKG